MSALSDTKTDFFLVYFHGKKGISEAQYNEMSLSYMAGASHLYQLLRDAKSIKDISERDKYIAGITEDISNFPASFRM